MTHGKVKHWKRNEKGEMEEKIIYHPPSVNWEKLGKKAKSKKQKRRERRKANKAKRRANNKKPFDRDTFFKSHEWARARYKALKNSSGHCELCGRTAKDGVMLVVDHIKPIHKYPRLKTDQNNLQVLCSNCNWGKWGDDETDWRTEKQEWPGLTLLPRG